MDINTFNKPFRESETPDWICPTCNIGILKILPNTFTSEEIYISRNHDYDGWEPEEIKLVYSCMLSCNNIRCKETVASLGTGKIDSYEAEDFRGKITKEYDSFYTPSTFIPPLNFFIIPDSCPIEISNPINESFKLALCAPSAAANSIRIAIEELLTVLGVKKVTRKDGKQHTIQLHHRIDNHLPAKYANIKDYLLAIKWIGNAGSHDCANVQLKDLIDAYNFIEHIIHEIYIQKSKHLAAQARKINKKKGPVRESRKRQ